MLVASANDEQAAEDARAKLRAEAEANERSALAASSGEIEAKAAERAVLDERRRAYEAATRAELDAAEVRENLRAGNGATVLRIPDDGNCIPRAALTAAGRASGDGDVARLRSEVLAAMASDRERYEPWVRQGLPETGPSPPGAPTGEVEGMFDRHLLRMQGSGIFFEEPELQCLADLFQRPIVVDAVVVASGDASRKSFEPKTVDPVGKVSALACCFFTLCLFCFVLLVVQ